MLRVRFALMVALVCGFVSNGSAQVRGEQARAVYEEGRAAYEQKRFDVAYDRFKQAYILTQAPALLYNISSALQGLGRPGAAAAALRAYLVQVPDEPDRAAIEQRIRALEDAERVIAREPTASTVARRSRSRRLTIGLSIGSVAVAGVVLGLGLGLGLAHGSDRCTEPVCVTLR